MAQELLADARDMFAVHTMFRREFGLLPNLISEVAADDEQRTSAAPTEPHWVANIESMESLAAEFADRTENVRATVYRDGPARERMYEIARAHWAFVAVDYEKRTSRRFPVILLQPV